MMRKLVTGLLFAPGLLATSLAACESDSATAPAIDASTNDASFTGTDAAQADVQSSPADATTEVQAPDASDAGTDAPTNNAIWTAASGIMPENACAPWTLIDTANPEAPALAGGKLTLATDVDAENMFYSQAALIVPAQLVIEARVRLVSGTGSTASRGPAFVGFRYGPDRRKNSLYLTTTEAFILTDENVKGAAAAVATTDTAHTYKIVANTTTHAVEVFRDGVSILTGAAFLEPSPGALPDISWGEGSNFGTGTSEWESVTHNAHELGPCP